MRAQWIGVLASVGIVAGWTPIEAADPAAVWRVEQRAARWCLVSPAGEPTWLAGLNHVAEGAPRERLLRDEYFDLARQRLEKAGFTNLGYGAPPELRSRLPYFADLHLTLNSHARGPDEFQYEDVFDPDWQQALRERIRALCEATRDDPLLIGYYWTDTPRWDIDLARTRRGDDWVSALRRLPAEAPGKRAYVEFLKSRYAADPARYAAAYGHSIAKFDDLLLFDYREFDRSGAAAVADDREFLRCIARELFRTAGAAYREFAPGRLVCGERYKLHDHPENVLAEAAAWIDVLALQPGPGAGPLPGPGDDERVFPAAEFRRLHALTGKPILICDHRLSFAVPDYPTTLWHQFPTEAAALAATQDYVLAAAAEQYLVGYQFCQYRDSFRPERGHMLKQGLIRADGEPYAESWLRIGEINRAAAEKFGARLLAP